MEGATHFVEVYRDKRKPSNKPIISSVQPIGVLNVNLKRTKELDLLTICIWYIKPKQQLH